MPAALAHPAVFGVARLEANAWEYLHMRDLCRDIPVSR